MFTSSTFVIFLGVVFFLLESYKPLSPKRPVAVCRYLLYGGWDYRILDYGMPC
jgi:hypothetical protein